MVRVVGVRVGRRVLGRRCDDDLSRCYVEEYDMDTI